MRSGAIAVAAAAAVLSGCASPPPRPPGTPEATAPAAVTPIAPTSAGLRVDESLLAHLPPAVDGVPIEFSPEASAEAARSLDLGGLAESVAYAVAVADPRPDLAIVTVVGLAGDGFDEPAFRDLRDTYDAEVCRPEGGVMGHAVAEIDGRTVHIGSCAGGGRTYHALLDRSDAIVSVYSAGEARLGEQLMSELRDS